MTLTGVKREVTMELLGDVATAVRNILRDFLPGIEAGMKIQLAAEPKPTLTITVDDGADPLYPHIITGRVDAWRLTNESRRLLGLPEKET